MFRLHLLDQACDYYIRRVVVHEILKIDFANKSKFHINKFQIKFDYFVNEKMNRFQDLRYTPFNTFYTFPVALLTLVTLVTLGTLVTIGTLGTLVTLVTLLSVFQYN
jgi:hypothetical protein